MSRTNFTDPEVLNRERQMQMQTTTGGSFSLNGLPQILCALVNADIALRRLDNDNFGLRSHLASEVDLIAIQMMAGANANPGSSEVTIEDMAKQGYLLA